MALKILVKDLNEIPESLRGEYKKQDDGSYMLDTDTGDYKSKLDEFRNNNIRLNSELAEQKKQLTAQMDRFKDIDPEKYKRAENALKILESNEEGKLIAEGKIDEVLARRTEQMRKEHENALNGVTKARDQFKNQAETFGEELRNLKLERFATDAFEGQGGVARIRQGAKFDVMQRARATWQLDDKGNPTPKNADGTVMFGKDGQTPISWREWAQLVIKDAPHLFEESGGGGAGGGQRDGGQRGDQTILDNDPKIIGTNLKDIASGKKKVVAASAT